MPKATENKRRVLVILNPVAGRGNHKQRHRIHNYLEKAGVNFELRETTSGEDAFRWAREANTFNLVIAAGGDGTVMEVMSGLVRRGLSVPLAQLPIGTGNLLAKAFGIPRHLEKALDLALNGIVVPLDLGYIPEVERHFAIVAGAGWDAQLITDATRRLKHRFGMLAYVMTGLKGLLKLQRSRVQLDIDGQHHSFFAHTVMVVNIGEFGPRFKLGEAISPHDGKLNLAIATPNTFEGNLRLAYRLLTRHYESYRDLRYYQATRIRVQAEPPLPLELDGEPISSTPFSVEVVPAGARLIVPASYVTT